MNCGRVTTLATLAALMAGSAGATEIFTWTDEDGVVHYSDTKPAEDQSVETLVVNRTNPPDYDPAEDPYSIANQAKRTNERWEAVEKAREERAEKREALAAAQGAPQGAPQATARSCPSPSTHRPNMKPMSLKWTVTTARA